MLLISNACRKDWVALVKISFSLPTIATTATRTKIPAVDEPAPVFETPTRIEAAEVEALVKYHRMVKMKLPLGAVRVAMERDGTSTK